MDAVKVKIHPFVDGDQAISEMLTAAAVATGKPTHAANVIRDSSNRVIAVDIGIEDNPSVADMVNAVDKVDNNPAAVFATSIPHKWYDRNFDELTPGAPILTLTQPTDRPFVNLSALSAPDALAVASPSAEAVGGTGSACKFTVGGGGILTRWRILHDAIALLNIQPKVYRLKFTIKRLSDGGTQNPTTGGDIRFNMDLGLGFGQESIANKLNGVLSSNWVIQVGSLGDIDTGEALTGEVVVDMLFDHNVGQLTRSIGAFSNVRSIASSYEKGELILLSASQNTGQAPHSLIFDNWSFEILDGSIL